jgi:xanthine/uracil/vitamin C permease (AzgA family)
MLESLFRLAENGTILRAFPIANGIALGFIADATAKLVSGRWRDASPSLLAPAADFVAEYTFF